MKKYNFFRIDKNWLDSLDYTDKEMVMLRGKLEARTFLLRISVALNMSLLAGIVIQILRTAGVF